MQTVSINIMSLCVPCENRCRYCLLSYDGKTVGADYQRSKNYALKFYNWIKKNRPELSFLFGFGYSMEHPSLLEEIKFLQSIESPTGEFLQFDGMKFRNDKELKLLLQELKTVGVKLIDLTFYGNREYHDKFATRKGDFDYMLNVLKYANEIGLMVQVGIALTDENAEQVEKLIEGINQFKTEKVFLFVPHCEGRGESLEKVRFSEKGFEKLGNLAKDKFNKNKFKTEKEWLNCDYVQPTKRMIAISLTEENINYFETVSFDEAIAYVENLDDKYYASVPSFTELARVYGDEKGDKFYSQRDLFLKYQKRYIKENALSVYDVNDERFCFSRRF